MTVHAVICDPPRDGLVLPRVGDRSPLGPGQAADLYAAMLKDTFRAVAGSGGDLLVNHPAEEDLPASHRSEDGPGAETELRNLVAEAVSDPGEVRFEVQVGSTFAARAGNAATHLLREEDADSVAILLGTAPTILRSDLDAAAMKFRRNQMVIGPAPDGRVAYFGLTEPVDFDGIDEPPEVETITNRGVTAGLDVDFLPMHPVVHGDEGLPSLVSTVRARRAAGRLVPEFTADILERLNLRVEAVDGTRRVVSGGAEP